MEFPEFFFPRHAALSLVVQSVHVIATAVECHIEHRSGRVGMVVILGDWLAVAAGYHAYVQAWQLRRMLHV